MTVFKILIIDDEELICNALQLVIQEESDMEVVGIGNNGVDALKLLETVLPDLILMDVRMPKMNGIECTKKIKERYPEMLILILTTYNEESFIIDGLAHGANGYLLKGTNFSQLIETIRSTLNGKYILPAEVAIKLSQFLLNTKTAAARNLHKLPLSLIELYALTKREQDILLLLGNRLSVREIANELYISEGTVKNYLTTVYGKLNVSNRYEAINVISGK
ncbi:DNA-binding response regulator [Psychrobacillus glaciei]|uniref:DNA-binding response regulator n=1 Tax=Psychrobacillus glaciei TaxID=2283160 RepID=A0A5J6SJS7_9BACI|nr:response regulator transcription factor [Psychrobacillus glaciei]QFF98088.1 DNA-binding response regulator [Psychrobacillus glaciei]